MFPGVIQDGSFYIWGKDSDTRATTGVSGSYISRDAKFRTYIHESGHCIEINSEDILSKSKTFLMYRTQGEKYIHVGPKRHDIIREGIYKGKRVEEVTITGKILADPQWEIGKKDKFFSPYCGKMYYQNSTNGGLELIGTEILSMGMEALFSFPEKFISKDPEYVRFVLGVLRSIGK